MKIYKFKDLKDEDKHDHFLQIVLNNTIWCASPDSLNDKDEEYKFKLNYEQSPFTAQLLSDLLEKRTSKNISSNLLSVHALENKRLEVIAKPIIEDIIDKCRNSFGITSFSIKNDDLNLWKEYAGEGNGVCVEINIPDNLVGERYHYVEYVKDKIFHVDSFLESNLYHKKAYRNMLLTKTEKWSHEAEIRFIGNRQDVNLIFDGFISKVTFGPNVPNNTLEKFKGLISEHCKKNNIMISQLLSKEFNL